MKARTAIVAIVLLVAGGCAGYQMGLRSLYPPDITTVYVPMIESDSFRRNLGERLTEAVIKEIEQKTPYKVVGSPDADSVLSARLVRDRKRVLVEDQNDEARKIELDFAVEVSWVNRRGDLIRQQAMLVVPPETVRIGAAASLVPEAGQSIATAQQKAIGSLAEQIVATMELPW